MANLVLLRGDERPRRGVFERESMHCSHALAMYCLAALARLRR